MSGNKGENLMYASIYNNILENIASNYVEIYKNHSIEKLQMQTNLINIDCGEWCEDCLKMFIDLDALDANDTMSAEDKKSTISYFRRGVCRGACLCTVDKLNVTSDVVFITENVIVDDVDVDVITEKLNTFLNEKYKKEGFTAAADRQKVSQIINDINVNLSTNITQSIATFQSVKLEGAGTIRNVSVEVLVRAVMVSMVKNKATIESITQFTQAIFEKIVQDVQKSFTSELTDMFKKYKAQIIVMFSLLGVAFCLQIFLVIYQVYAIAK